LFKRGTKKEVKAVAGQVLIMDKRGTAEPVPESDTPELAQYEAAQVFLTKPLRLGAEKLELVAGDTAAVSFYVDGMRYDGDAMDRNSGGAAVQLLKRVAGLDMNEHRKPQTGTFRAALDGQKFTLQITALGSAVGESVRLITNPKERQNLKVEDLGFGEEQLQIVQDVVADGGGLVLLAAPRGQGLTTLCYAMVRAHDAFLFHVHTVERGPEVDLEGVTQNALAANASPADEAKQVSWVISQEPDVVMISSIEDPRSAADLAKFAGEKRRVYVAFRTGSTLEAVRQWRKLVGDDNLALKKVKAVIGGRLVRRLCSACKVGYTPDPNMLRKLNMNPDAVGKLYQARKEPMRDAKGNAVPCTFCHDLAFRGRFGIYEVMLMDDELANAIKSGATDNQVRQIQRKKRGMLLQEAALAQVRAGETSVEEVLRVLKPESGEGGGGKPAPRPQSGPKPAAPPAAPRTSAPRQARPAGG
jgi:general secretion pathway protein E